MSTGAGKQRMNDPIEASLSHWCHLLQYLSAWSYPVLLKDVGLRWVYANPAILDLFGLTGLDYVGHSDAEILGPEAAAICNVSDHRAMANGDLSEDIDRIMERAFLTFKMPLAEQEKTVGLLTIAFEIADLEITEQELRIVTAKAFDAQESIFITDPQKRILLINNAFTRVTGYTFKEVISQTPAILHSGHQDRAFYQAMWDTITRTGFWEGEIWNRRKNGEIYPEWEKIHAVINKNGQVTHYMAHFTDISERKAQEEKLRQMALYDGLTGLPNRRLLEAYLEQAMARAQRHQKLLAVVMMDLDGFKPVNDTYSHSIGDEVLQVIGRRLRKVLRKTDFVARWGGDEFALLIEDLADLNGLRQALSQVEEAITTPIPLHNSQSIQIAASAGVYIYPFGEEKTGELLLHCANQALYHSKSHKADRECFWILFGEDGVSSENEKNVGSGD